MINCGTFRVILSVVGTVPTIRTFNRIVQVLANRLKPCEQLEREELFFSGSTTPVTSFFVLFSLCLLHFVEFAGMRFAQ